MMRKFPSLVSKLAVAVYFCAVLSACSSRPAPVPPSTGDRPSFQLHDLKGRSHDLSDFKGKFVLLHFWASWCIPCTYELARLQHFSTALSKDPLIVVGIAIDDEGDAVMDLVQYYRLSFPVLIDPRGETKQLFGLTGLPHSILIDPQGKLISILDPNSMKPSSFVAGPREWDKPAVIEAFKNFVRTNSSR